MSVEVKHKAYTEKANDLGEDWEAVINNKKM